MLLLVFPTYSLSEDFPAWDVIGERACYTLDGAKKLKLFEVDCSELQATNTQLTLQVLLLRDSNSEFSKANTGFKQAIDLLTQVVEEDKVFIKGLGANLEDEYAWSLRGGALPWVVVGGLVCAGAGLAAGLYLAK